MTNSIHPNQRRRSVSFLARTAGSAGVAVLLTFGFIGCKSSSNNAATTAAVNNGTDNGTDPAEANLAPASGSTQVLGSNSSYTPQQQSESYPSQSPAPVVQGYNGQDQADEYAGEQAVDYATEPPPPLPEYDQPPDPDPNYIWTPGYWAWGDGGYYWVPGSWCPPPYYGALWTPPYWGYDNGRYGFHRGYWGPHIGYYGGVDYGYGYIGIGYFGGYWHGNDFYYNRAVTNVGRGGYTYDHAVVYNNVHYNGRIQNRVSYNGGNGGLNVRPRPSEMAALHESHTAALPEQRQVAQGAAQNKQQFFSANHGKPVEIARTQPIAAAHPIAAPPAAVVRDQQHAEQVRATMAQHPAAPEQRGAAPMERNNAPAAEHGNPPAAMHNNAQPMENRGNPAMENRGAPMNHAAPAEHAAPTRPNEARPTPMEHAQPQRQPTPQARPQETQRPTPQAHPEPAPRTESRPAPAPRPEARPEARPAPAARPAPQPHVQSHPAPAPHPAPHEAPHDEHPH